MSPSPQDSPSSPDHTEGAIAGLFQRVIQDAQTLTRDELALAKIELIRSGERTAVGLATLLLGGVLLLMSLGLLCVTAVVGLAPLISALWLRMLLMSLVFMCLGSLLMAICGAWLWKEGLSLPKTKRQAKQTLTTIQEEVQHARS